MSLESLNQGIILITYLLYSRALKSRFIQNASVDHKFEQGI